jgi:hypothetical protein
MQNINDSEAAEALSDTPMLEESLPDLTLLNEKFRRLKQKFAKRDTTMSRVAAVRAGRISEVMPAAFPASGPWQEPIIANTLDIAAHDLAEMLAPLPSFNCSSPTMTNDRARENASLRTKIVQGYIAESDLQVQMLSAADWYITYGFLPIRVEIDYERKLPILQALDPMGSYYQRDRFGRIINFFQRKLINRDELCDMYPEWESKLRRKNGVMQSSDLEVIFYHDANWDLAFVPGHEPILLESVANPLGKPLIHVAERAGISDVPRGQFDDVLFVQLAKARFALLALEAAEEAVHAPLVVPLDVQDIPIGPGSIIKTSQPGSIGRVPLEIPNAAFQESSQLERELQFGSRFPQVRSGNLDASIVTGKGVQALMGGYESQIVAHQAILARSFSILISLCFQVDEKLFGDIEKEIQGAANGATFVVKYIPSKVIKGNYQVDVRYGLMAGLDPNRFLVFALQAQAAGMFSKDFMRREMPIQLDVEDEVRKMDIEELENAAKQAIMGYAQSIPALASQGQDPTVPLMALVKVVEDRRKGKPLVDAVVEALTPPAPEPAPAPVPGSPEEAAAAAANGQGSAPGLSANGLMQGVAPGQAGQAPGGRPDLATMLAGLDARGNANLSANVMRRKAV